MSLCQRCLLSGAIGTTVVAPVTTLSAATSSASTSPTVSPVGATVACSTAIAPAPLLGHAETHFGFGLLTPFGVAFGPDGKHAFVDSLINPSTPPSRLTPMMDAGAISQYSVSASGLVSERLGMAVSQNGRDLVAAGGTGASVFSVSRIEQPNSGRCRSATSLRVSSARPEYMWFRSFYSRTVSLAKTTGPVDMP